MFASKEVHSSDFNPSQQDQNTLVKVSRALKEQFPNMSLEAIYSIVCITCHQLARNGYKLHLKEQKISEKQLQAKLEENLKSYPATTNTALSTLQALKPLADIGPTGLFTAAFGAVTLAAQGVGKLVDNTHDCENRKFNHENQSINRMIEHAIQTAQEKRQERSQWLDKESEVQRSAQENFRAAVSAR